MQALEHTGRARLLNPQKRYDELLSCDQIRRTLRRCHNKRLIKCLFCGRRKQHVPRFAALLLLRKLRHDRACLCIAHAESLKNARHLIARLFQIGKQNVLRANVYPREAMRFFLGKRENFSTEIGKMLEHRVTPP